MATTSEILKFIIQGDARSAEAALRELNAGLDGTESAGKRVAAQMRAMAAAIDAESRDAAGAAEALGSALGPELIADIERAGGSLDGLIADLQRAGLTYDEVRADANELADAIRYSADVQKTAGAEMRAGADQAADGLDRVRTSGDQSRSVLANLVGNSAQDLGQLGGVAGTAGVAIGQLAEYAVDGNISVSNLAKMAGPMLGVAAAGLAISKGLEAIKASAAEAKRETAALLEVQEQIRDGQFAEASSALAEEYRETIRLAADYGLSVQDVVDQLTGQRDITTDLRRRQAELDAELTQASHTRVRSVQEIQEEKAALDAVLRNLDQMPDRYAEAGRQLEYTTAVTKDLESSLSSMFGTTKAGVDVLDAVRAGTDDLTAATEAATKAEEAAAEARQEAIDKQRAATQAAEDRLAAERDLRGELLSQVDAQRAYEAAVDDGEGAVAEFNETMAASESTLEDIDDAARSAADALIGQAEAFATSKGAADGSKESIRLQIEELYTLAAAMDPSSPLRARLLDYIGELQSIPATINTRLNLNISSGAVTTSGGDIIGQRGGARAFGGPTAPNTVHPVNERGPELYEENGRQYLLTGPSGGHVTPVPASTSSPARVGSSTGPAMQLVVNGNVYGDAHLRRLLKQDTAALIGRLRAGRR